LGRCRQDESNLYPDHRFADSSRCHSKRQPGSILMLFPSNLDQKISFVKIKDLLKAECTSSLGQNYVDKVAFSSDFNLVQRLLDQTDEFLKILISGEIFPQSHFTNLN